MSESIHELAYKKARHRDQLANALYQKAAAEKKGKARRRLLFYGVVFGAAIYNYPHVIRFADALDRIKKLNDEAKLKNMVVKEVNKRRMQLLDQISEGGGQGMVVAGAGQDENAFKDIQYARAPGRDGGAGAGVAGNPGGGAAGGTGGGGDLMPEGGIPLEMMWGIPSPEELEELKKKRSPYAHDQVPEQYSAGELAKVDEHPAGNFIVKPGYELQQEIQNLSQRSDADSAKLDATLAEKLVKYQKMRPERRRLIARPNDSMYELVLDPPLEIGEDKREYPDVL